MKPSAKKALILLAKLAVAGGLLAYVLVAKVHWRDYTETVRDDAGQVEHVQCRGLLTTLAEAEPALLAGALACFAVPILILAVRWWYLLRMVAIRVGLWESVRLTFLGYFFNYLVPGMVSGDLVKAYYACKHTQRKAAALVSIFVDRMIGLLQFALLPAVVLGVLAGAGRWSERFDRAAVVVAVVLAVIAVGLAVLLAQPLRVRVGRLLSFGPLARHLAVAARAVELYRRRLRGMGAALALTFGSQVIHVLGILLIGRALGLPIAWYEYFLYTPLVYIISAIPISPGGLGVMEWCFVTFFAAGAATPSEAMALALLARLGPMICSLPGIVVALTGPRLPKAESIQAELAAEAAS